MTEKQLRRKVADQIVAALRYDLPHKMGGQNGESLMKEVYEMCDSDCDMAIVYDEMQVFIRILEATRGP